MGIIHSKNYSITKKLFNKIFIQKIWKLFIQKNYSFFWKIDYRPGLGETGRALFEQLSNLPTCCNSSSCCSSSVWEEAWQAKSGKFSGSPQSLGFSMKLARSVEEMLISRRRSGGALKWRLVARRRQLPVREPRRIWRWSWIMIMDHDQWWLIMTTLFNLMHHVGDDNYHPDADAAWRASSPLLFSGRS